MRRLVVAEKGSAALRLAVLLSGGTFDRRRRGVTVLSFERGSVAYDVVGLRGHIVEVDYPEALRDWGSTDLDALLRADVVATVSEPEIGDALRALAAEADEAWIATDFDREGELIGVEALRIAREARPGLPARRVRFSALTRVAVEEAFANPSEVDEPLAASARAREIVDLAWGAVLTRFLSLACGMRGRDFLSVGRVQTPTLGLLVEREREVEEFVPMPFWTVAADLGDGGPLRAEHAHGRFWRRGEAEAAQGRAELAEGASVVSLVREEARGGRPPPMNTTSFVAEASRLGLTAAKAMKVAEDLYRSGRISYPRTDNTVYPPSLNLRRLLEQLGDSDLAAEASELGAQDSIRPSRGRLAATDHPPIHPAAGATRRELKGDAWRVYELVARRFFATVAPAAREEATEARLDLAGEAFVARGRRLLEPGWHRYYGAPFAATVLPDLAAGGVLTVRAVTCVRGETEPPAPYSQGRLVQEMERRGLGTKSTRHEIVQKLYARDYVEGRRMRVTAGGRAIVEALEAYGGDVARPEMTARLEAAMDAIARGERTIDEVVAVSRDLLGAVLAKMRSHEAGIADWIRTAIADEREVGPCESCGGTMTIRKTRTGRRFVGCSNYPECRNSRAVPRPGLLVPSLQVCGDCGSRKVARVRRGVADLRCVTPTCSDAELAEILGA